jgi:hypothetical protein
MPWAWDDSALLRYSGVRVILLIYAFRQVTSSPQNLRSLGPTVLYSILSYFPKRTYRLQPPRLSNFHANFSTKPRLADHPPSRPTKSGEQRLAHRPPVPRDTHAVHASPGLPEFPSLLLPPACALPLCGLVLVS